MRCVLLLFTLSGLCGCTTTVSPRSDLAIELPPQGFSYADLDEVLRRHVDEAGRVDYAALSQEPEALERFYASVAATSPHADPGRFATREDALTYWINSYNAAVLEMVLRYYPITGVTDVKEPWYLAFLPERSGFFYLHRLVFGSERISLYDLENDIVRAEFSEPRIHFALNCGSIGCPRLPTRAFTVAGLDAELERETRRFLSEERNLRIDHGARRVHLSSIFDWYRKDFAASGESADLLAWIAEHVDAPRAAELERARAYSVEFEPYDWALNDQATAMAGPQG